MLENLNKIDGWRKILEKPSACCSFFIISEKILVTDIYLFFIFMLAFQRIWQKFFSNKKDFYKNF